MKPLENQTLNQLMEQTARLYPKQCAMTFRGKIWTYPDMNSITDALAAGLLASGAQKGDHIGILSENSPNAVFAFLAVIKAGCVACMLNTSLKTNELLSLLEISDIRFLMMGNNYKGKEFYPQCLELSQSYPVKQIFDIGQVPSSRFSSINDLISLGHQNLSVYDQSASQLTPQDDCMILYTSGTTGTQSKAVLSTHFHVVNGGIQKAHSLGMTEQDIVCCALQLFHIFCIDVNIMAAIASGACLAMPVDMHSSSILDTLESEKCTVLSCVPFTYRTILSKPDFSRKNLSQLRTGIIGGAYCSPENFIKIERSFGFTLLPGLGQTEAIAGIAVGYPDDSIEIRSTTVGHLIDHSEGKILDLENGNVLPYGMPGEICIRGPLLMKGYYKQPELTAEIIDDEGWLHTGDIGYLTEDHILHYIGRKKELINRGGEKIIPAEIETLIAQIPGISCCKVIGLPDPMYGEEVCACIVPKSPDSINADEILDYLKKHLATFKLPKKIVFFDNFPINASGKIQMVSLTKMAMEAVKQ